ncbi:uncharacterized protein [Elaeis guineensis]|uniref:Uncharacterized protein LOC105038268 n=1 Tax=Elaeis guineensis var. tenera TaxID=51953 RepID=A0A6I9QNQ4_ELAGV|nr:uncharacterized protein LOC105038268 [Elaeis guineensis]
MRFRLREKGRVGPIRRRLPPSPSMTSWTVVPSYPPTIYFAPSPVLLSLAPGISLFSLPHGGAPRDRTPVTAAAAEPMESFRHQQTPGSDRFLGLVGPPRPANGTVLSAGEDELHEDEIFWTGADNPSSEPNRYPMKPSPAIGKPNPSPATIARAGFRRLPDRNFGILAALLEDDKKPPTAKASPPFQYRNAAARSPTSSPSSSTSPSSVSTCARMIPVVPKMKPESALSMPGGKIYHQSAPLRVPVAPAKMRRGWGEFEMDDRDLDGDEEMLPPHEIVARRSGNGSPMTTFSVLEGVGRTLKGRDLRQVRNAVWRKTGFLDL